MLRPDLPTPPSGPLTCALVAMALWSLPFSAVAEEWVYEVRPGDSMARVALEATGDSMRFDELRALNVAKLDVDGELVPGTVLELPPGWRLPGAVPSYELNALGGETVQGLQREDFSASGRMVRGEVRADSIIDLGEMPAANLWEQLSFFPALRELEGEFETLMLRASYNSDVDWGAAKVAERQARTRALLEQEILAAETRVGKAEARKRECRRAAERAEMLLTKYYKFADSEFEERKKEIVANLAKAVQAEAKMWEEDYWRDLTLDARQAWEDFRVELVSQEWVAAYQRHADLEPYRIKLIPPDRMNDFERSVFWGSATKDALRDLLDLRSDDAYRVESIQRKRFKDALNDIKQLESCEADFVDAKHFVDQKRRKLVQLQASVAAGTADALTTDAKRIADKYSGILGEVQLVDAYLSNETWSKLWWKAGVALRLSGDHEKGKRRIEQAAAVSTENRLPSGEVPRSVETWMREGENEILRKPKGLVRVHVPATATVTVDGRDLNHKFGEAEIYLAPGVHRMVFWIDGSEPMMRLIGVAPGENHEFVWYEPTQLTGDQEFVTGKKPVLPVLPKRDYVKRWQFGVRAAAGQTLGRPHAGVELTARYLPYFIGGELTLGMHAPFKPMWLGVGEELVAFARLHGAVLGRAKIGKFDLVGGVGGYADPFLGAGPSLRLEAGYWVKKDAYRVSIGAWGAYDAMPHFDEIPRFSINGGASFWF